MSDAILTVPQPEPPAAPAHLTGNEYVVLPAIDPVTGAVLRAGGNWGEIAALREMVGDAATAGLFRPFWNDAETNGLTWELLGDWVPRWTWAGDGLEVAGTVFAPLGEKGFCYLLEAENRSGGPRDLTLGWEAGPAFLWEKVFSSRDLGPAAATIDSWTGALVREGSREAGGPAMAALVPGAAWEPAGAVSAGSHRAARSFRLAPGERAALSLYAAFNRERDGASLWTVHLARRGGESMLTEFLGWLEERSPKRAPRGGLSRLLNRNLFFNYFYSSGRTLDREETVLVTSRSSRYYVASAFWARDTFLWSLPGVLLVEPRRAREILEAGFARHLRAAGVHAHYPDGTLLYPGFELDQWAAYFLALERYREATGEDLGREEPFRSGLPRLLAALPAWKHPRLDLYATFLDPSDDPPAHPYLIYDNVLAWKALRVATDAGERLGEAWAHEARTRAERLEAAIWEFGVVDGPAGQMFAWAVDGDGRHQLYDSPPGSLGLIPHYGFCSPDHPVFTATLDWIYSPANPDYCPGAYGGPGCRHARYPWVLALANLLLTPRWEEALRLLETAPLDGGLACETLDPATGRLVTGAAFATCAGFLAYALERALREGSGEKGP